MTFWLMSPNSVSADGSRRHRSGAFVLAFAMVILLIAAPGLATAAARVPATCAPDKVIFQTPTGQKSIAVEIADDADERAQGLMFRRNLPEGEGMLFIYDSAREVSFWMRNTLIPLDMIFLDRTGVIRHVHAKARPLDETPIPGAVNGDPDPRRLMVLELAGGEAARLGLSPGQVMAHPRIPQPTAAWPCR